MSPALYLWLPSSLTSAPGLDPVYEGSKDLGQLVVGSLLVLLGSLFSSQETWVCSGSNLVSKIPGPVSSFLALDTFI